MASGAGGNLTAHSFIMCFLADGTPDLTFGTDGICTTQALPYNHTWFWKMAIDTEGRIIAVGSADSHTIAVRYLSDGTLDPEFGQAGQVRMILGSSSHATDVVMDGEGRIVLCADVYNLSGHEFGVLRLLANGTVDPTFSDDGVVTNAIGVSADTRTVAVYPDGKILVGGNAIYTVPEELVRSLLVRYLENGSLDDSFGVGGIDTLSTAGNNWEMVYDMVIRPDGGIVATGQRIIPENSEQSGYLLQLTPNGSLDQTFNLDGQIMIPELTFATQVTLQPDGKVLVSGGEVVVERYDTDGTLDMSFGIAGTVTHPSGYAITGVEGACLQNDGKLLLCGSVYDGFGIGDNSLMVVRLLTDFDAGIAEFKPLGNVLIYPNPIADRAAFKYELEHTERLAAGLLDAHGKVVRTLFSDRLSPAGQYSEIFDMTGLPDGSYLLMLSNANGSTSIKLTKQAH